MPMDEIEPLLGTRHFPVLIGPDLDVPKLSYDPLDAPPPLGLS